MNFRMRKFLRVSFIIALVAAISSCSKEDQIGDPYMLFEIHGIVMDQDGNPIEGIEVSAGTTDVVKTNTNGNFTYHGRSVPMSSARLTFQDKDGDANGGEFLSQTFDVELRLKTPGEDNGNFKGKYFAQGVEFRLLPKNAELKPNPEI